MRRDCNNALRFRLNRACGASGGCTATQPGGARASRAAASSGLPGKAMPCDRRRPCRARRRQTAGARPGARPRPRRHPPRARARRSSSQSSGPRWRRFATARRAPALVAVLIVGADPPLVGERHQQPRPIQRLLRELRVHVARGMAPETTRLASGRRSSAPRSAARRWRRPARWPELTGRRHVPRAAQDFIAPGVSVAADQRRGGRGPPAARRVALRLDRRRRPSRRGSDRSSPTPLEFVAAHE